MDVLVEIEKVLAKEIQLRRTLSSVLERTHRLVQAEREER
jgi:hypothetical protein